MPGLARPAPRSGEVPLEHVRKPTLQSVGKRLSVSQQPGRDRLQGVPIEGVSLAGKRPVFQSLAGLAREVLSDRKPFALDVVFVHRRQLAQIRISQELTHDLLRLPDRRPLSVRVALQPHSQRLRRRLRPLALKVRPRRCQDLGRRKPRTAFLTHDRRPPRRSRPSRPSACAAARTGRFARRRPPPGSGSRAPALPP